MNQFVGKKIGEVMAFASAGQEILKQGPQVATVLSDTEKLKNSLIQHYRELEQAARDQGEIARAKAEATGAKLARLADIYIGDEWDNPVEVLEWLSFYSGAAAAHSALVLGAAEQLQERDLVAAISATSKTFQALSGNVAAALYSVGHQRAEA